MLQKIWRCLLVLAWLPFFPMTGLRAADEPSYELVQQILKLIGDPDREFRAAGLEQLRSGAKGAEATKLFASQLGKLDADGQAALLTALADRRDAVALPAVLEFVSAGKDANVRAAAIAAVGSLGSATDVPLLIKPLSGEPSAERDAAKQALVRLSGDNVNRTVIQELKSAEANVKAQLIEILAIRRARDQGVFLTACRDGSPQVRRAAMNAIGQLGRPELLQHMLQGVLKAQPGDERDNAERNVALVFARIKNEDERGNRLIEALNVVRAEDRHQLLSLMGRVGGARLIDFVGNVATSQNAAERQLGIDALSNWPDASVADKLLEIAGKATDPSERNLAFQGYVKVAAARDNRNDKERLERMKQAMKAAKTPDEQSLVINRTRTAYDVDAMRFVLPYVDQPPFAQIACETIVEIAHHREVRDPNKAEFDKALDKVIKTANDPVVIDRAQRYKRGETWERPKKK
jgi:HEAT repeat protein